MARLLDIEQRLRSAKEVRVGFMETARYPNGTQVALVAVVNEFGAPSRGIPSRPFFRNMIAQRSPEWGASLARILKQNDYNARAALDLMGADIAAQLRESIVDFTGVPLSPKTIKRKGFSKQLIDKGDMVRAVDHEVVT